MQATMAKSQRKNPLQSLTWAQIMSLCPRDRKKKLTLSVSEICRMQNQEEPRETDREVLHQSIKASKKNLERYLAPSSNQPQNQIPSTDLLSLSNTNQPVVVNQGSDAGGQQNPSGRGRGRDVRATIRCDHCQRIGHIDEWCWFLHPSLRPMKEKQKYRHQKNTWRGGGGAERSRWKEGGDQRGGEQRGGDRADKPRFEKKGFGAACGSSEAGEGE